MDVSQHVQSVMERIRQAALAARAGAGGDHPVRGDEGSDRRDHPGRHCRRGAGVRREPGAGAGGPSGRRRLCRGGAGPLHRATFRPTRSNRWWATWISSSRWALPIWLQAIQNQADKQGLVQDILLEVNIGQEESKGGCMPQEVEALAVRPWT